MARNLQPGEMTRSRSRAFSFRMIVADEDRQHDEHRLAACRDFRDFDPLKRERSLDLAFQPLSSSRSQPDRIGCDPHDASAALRRQCERLLFLAR